MIKIFAKNHFSQQPLGVQAQTLQFRNKLLEFILSPVVSSSGKIQSQSVFNKKMAVFCIVAPCSLVELTIYTDYETQ
jgi:hypothetical protein